MPLVDLSMVEQRYDAVREVLDGATVKVTAIGYGVDRRTLHRWLVRYANDGLTALAAKSLFRCCEAEEITFTRTRPYRKNDNCFVEQKNWPVVRQQVGYLRYETPQELAVLKELYSHLRLHVNFFQPQMKLESCPISAVCPIIPARRPSSNRPRPAHGGPMTPNGCAIVAGVARGAGDVVAFIPSIFA